MNVAGVSGLPTLSQLWGWKTVHLNAAAARWRGVADKWATTYDEIADALPTPQGTVWEGDGSQAAQARTNRDRAGVETLAERLRVATQIAENGADAINAAKREAMLVVGAASAVGFEVGEDLAVVDRAIGWPPHVEQLRQRQAELLALNVRLGAAQLAVVDLQVANDISKVTAGFDAVDFKRSPIVEPVAEDQGSPSFGECFSENFKDDIGENMVQGVFIGGLLGAARGALIGILGGPMGVFGGSVLGFVGGAGSGAMISGPVRTSVTSAWDCL